MSQSILNNDVKYIQKRMNDISRMKKNYGTQKRKIQIQIDTLDAEKKILQDMLDLNEKYKHFKEKKK